MDCGNEGKMAAKDKMAMRKERGKMVGNGTIVSKNGLPGVSAKIDDPGALLICSYASSASYPLRSTEGEQSLLE